MRAIFLALTLVGCSSVPLEHHDDYTSLSDYLRRGYLPPKLDRYPYFEEETSPLELSVGNTQLTYVGDERSKGYYLRVSAPLAEGTLRERVFCSLSGSPSLDAYSEGVLTNSGGIITYATWFRKENPCGPRDKEWEEIQDWFTQVRAEFVTGAGKNPLYNDAIARVR